MNHQGTILHYLSLIYICMSYADKDIVIEVAYPTKVNVAYITAVDTVHTSPL